VIALSRDQTGSILYLKSTDTSEFVVKPDTSEERKHLETHTHLTKKVFGLFGMLKLVVGTYLIFIDNASVVGEVLNAQIYRVESLIFVRIDSGNEPMEIQDQDQSFVDMIQSI